jgi:hypothetical protein
VYPGGAFTPDPTWIRDVHYRVEKDRGLPEIEDVFRIGRIAAALTPGDAFAIMASSERPTSAAYDWREALDSVEKRHRKIVARSRLPTETPDCGN